MLVREEFLNSLSILLLTILVFEILVNNLRFYGLKNILSTN